MSKPISWPSSKAIVYESLYTLEVSCLAGCDTALENATQAHCNWSTVEVYQQISTMFVFVSSILMCLLHSHVSIACLVILFMTCYIDVICSTSYITSSTTWRIDSSTYLIRLDVQAFVISLRVESPSPIHLRPLPLHSRGYPLAIQQHLT